ncbi:unnamed protein product [Mucor circinelloides]
MKKCAGAFRCINEDCEQDYNVDIRPPIAMSENRGSTVTMVHNTEKAQHMHRFYNNSLHLARWEKKGLNKEKPNFAAAAAIVGIDPATGAIKESIRNINKVLGKYSPATLEINRSKIQQGIILSANDVVAEFERLENITQGSSIQLKSFPASFLSAFVRLKW